MATMDTILCLFVLLLAAFVDADSSPLTISPAHSHITLPNREDWNVSCSSPANFSQCQFKVGEQRIIDTPYVFDGDSGRCQLTNHVKTHILDGTYMAIGCRVRQEGGDWSYATSSVYWSRRKALDLNLAPSKMVASPGKTFNKVATSRTLLANCTVLLKGVRLGLNDTPPSCQDNVCYHGNGLERGDCGVSLRNLSEKDNGKLWLRLRNQTDAEGITLVYIIIAKPPQSLTLKYSVKEEKDGTSTLEAWCSVIGGRPTPDVEWSIAGVPVKEGVASVPDDKWAWPSDERNLNQSLTRTMQEGDLGKELKCTATSAGGQTLSDAKLLPKPPQSLTLKYSVKVEEDGTSTLEAWCSVIGGRPTPEIEWSIAGVPVKEGVASVPDDKWAWPSDERNLNQSLTRTLREGERGKELRCTATSAGGQTLSDAKLLRSITTRHNFIDASDGPENLNHKANYGDSPHYSVTACALFGVAIFLYVAVLSLADFITFAWRRDLWCFRRLSYESGTSLDTEVMDYHATIPSGVILREASVTEGHTESYLEPMQTAQRQDSRESYFMPVIDQSNRSSSAKIERTLGLANSRNSKQHLPSPRFVQSTLKKQKSNSSTLKSAQKSLYMPTPVEQILDQLGASGSSDETPIYHNLFPAAQSDPMYLNISPNTEETLPEYGNLGEVLYGNIETTKPNEVEPEPEPTYGNVYPQGHDDDRTYGNF